LVFQPVAGRYEVNPAAGTLRIVNVERSDEGNYACVVNTTGQPVIVSGNAHLYVESMIFPYVSVVDDSLAVYIKLLQHVSLCYMFCVSKKVFHLSWPS